MSLEIYTTQGECFVTHIDDRARTHSETINDIKRIIVDGDELKRALEIIGLPQYGQTMRFYGDTAKYVVGNFFN